LLPPFGAQMVFEGDQAEHLERYAKLGCRTSEFAS
jgi:hypothetical protein